jgi:translation initiation factor IF-3
LKNANLNWRINHQIRASEVRVIGPDGKQIGVLKLTDALKEAEKQGLDLVEIAPLANPPVVKIADLGKLKYEEEKKLQKEKKGQKGGDTKEIRFSPFIGEADYQTRLIRIKEFLAEKNKVRTVVKFGGRQMGSKDFGYKVLKRILADTDPVNIDMEPKFLGRNLIMVISPTNKKVVKEEIKNNAKTKN